MPKRLKIFTASLGLFSLLAGATSASVMDSANYHIEADSLNIGGERQTSTNYIMEDTIGETATGSSDSSSYKLKAGYQQMTESSISVSSPSDVTMSPSIGGVSGGSATGEASWTVTTDEPAGYSLSVKAGSSPALRIDASDYFSDYAPSEAGTPDFNWSVGSSAAEFGFTPEGGDIVQKFKDDGAECGKGSSDTSNACWYNFSTGNESIAYSSSANHTSGTATKVKFKAESGSSNVQKEGSYTATITVTAVTN